MTVAAEQIFCLKGIVGFPKVTVLLKDDGGAYNPVDYMDAGRRSLLLPAGVYRFDRAGGTCGVFSG